MTNKIEAVDNVTNPEGMALLVKIIEWAEESARLEDAFGMDRETVEALEQAFPGWGWWSQRSWALDDRTCGTAYCIAGQAAHLNNYRMLFPEYGTAMHCVPVAPVGVDRKGRPILEPCGDEVEIANVARELLGLTRDEAKILFHENNEVDDLKAIANWIALSHDQSPPYPDHHVFSRDDYEDNEDF